MTDRYARALAWIRRNEHDGEGAVTRALDATASEPDDDDIDALRAEVLAPFNPARSVPLGRAEEVGT